jgi:hypothetical protein
MEDPTIEILLSLYLTLFNIYQFKTKLTFVNSANIY